MPELEGFIRNFYELIWSPESRTAIHQGLGNWHRLEPEAVEMHRLLLKRCGWWPVMKIHSAQHIRCILLRGQLLGKSTAASFFLLTVLRCKERRLVQSTRLIAMRVYSTALTQITPAIAIHNLQSPAHSFTALDNQLANKRSTIREIYIRYAQYVGLGMPLQLPLSPAHTRLDMARAVPTIWQETRH